MRKLVLRRIERDLGIEGETALAADEWEVQEREGCSSGSMMRKMVQTWQSFILVVPWCSMSFIIRACITRSSFFENLLIALCATLNGFRECVRVCTMDLLTKVVDHVLVSER